MKIAVLAIVVFSAVLSGLRADAQTGGGELGPGYVRATARDLGNGTFPGAGLPARAPSTEPLFAWQREPSAMACVVLQGPVPPELSDRIRPIPGPTLIIGEALGPGLPIDVPAGAVAIDRLLVPPDAIVVGDLVYDVGTRPGFVLAVPRCGGPGTPLLGEPPSPAEIWQETPLPRTEVHASPPGTLGVAGYHAPGDVLLG